MSIRFAKVFPQNMLLNNKYWRCINNRQVYLFILGLTLSVGDFKLILATSLFASSILFSYQFKNIYNKFNFDYFNQFLTSENRQLIFSVISAGTFAIIAYIITNIWTEVDNKWLALGIIWQIIFSTIGISFLSYKLWKRKENKNKKSDFSLDDLINQLNSDSALKRLWAINKIMELWIKNQLTHQQINQIKEYFILLQDLEIEPIIINKLNRSLEAMLAEEIKPLNIPQPVKIKKPMRVNHVISESIK